MESQRRSRKRVEYKHMTFYRGGAACEGRAGKRDVADALQPVAYKSRKNIWMTCGRFFRRQKREKMEMSAELNFE